MGTGGGTSGTGGGATGGTGGGTGGVVNSNPGFHSATVTAGGLAKSANFKLVYSVGDAVGNTVMTSETYTLNGGIVGQTQ
jgi:hypothetical protein